MEWSDRAAFSRNSLVLPLVAIACVSFATPRAADTGQPRQSLSSGECFIVAGLGEGPTVSDQEECSRKTAPASTFKIPHALIALQTGVITPSTTFVWDGTQYAFETWRRGHTVDSAIKWSVFPFFQRTARLIGRQRMVDGLSSLGYADDTFQGDVAAFWINGELVVSPLEQFAFLQRFFAGKLHIDAGHVSTVRRALQMPQGQITNAADTHAFALAWPRGAIVRAKTGNTTVNNERASWLVGEVEWNQTGYVFVARRRSTAPLENTAGADLALRGLAESKRRFQIP